MPASNITKAVGLLTSAAVVFALVLYAAGKFKVGLNDTVLGSLYSAFAVISAVAIYFSVRAIRRHESNSIVAFIMSLLITIMFILLSWVMFTVGTV